MNAQTRKKIEYNKIIQQLQEYCTCSLGQEKAAALLPSRQLMEIRKGQKETTEAKEIYRKDPLLPFGGIHDITSAVRKAEVGGILEPGAFLEIGSTLMASRRLQSFLLNRTEDTTQLGYLAKCLGVFPELEKRIETCIGEDGGVKDTASPELLRLRRQIANQQNRVREKLEGILRQSDLQKFLQESIITMRGNRYVVPVKQEHRNQFPGIVHDQSASGATVYIEPMAVVEIDNEIRRIQAEERTEVLRILRELSIAVAGEREEIRASLTALAQLDFAFAKAKYSHHLEGEEPIFNEQGWLEIRQGRHPLITGKVVPLTVTLGKDFDSLVITGPNTGGKTVALKTVGLIVLMAQAGLHVPVDVGTSLCVFDAVFVDIGDEQSIEQSLSTFSSHMTNIVQILQKLQGQSLVLLDELAAGTDPTEGAALAIGILEHLLQRGAKTIATTHYSELKVFAFNHSQVENASVEFNEVTLQPTYRLQIGLPGKSNAFAIVQRLGLAESIVDNARQYLSAEELQVGDLIQNLRETQMQSQADLQQTQHMRQLQERQVAQLQSQQEAWAERETRMLQKAHTEAIEIVRQARTEADGILRQLRQMQKEAVDRETLREAQAKQERLREQYTELYEEWSQVGDKVADQLQLISPPDREKKAVNMADHPNKAHTKGKRIPQFKQGDLVLIPRLNLQGYVLTSANQAGEVQVQAGILKIHLPISDLKPVSEKKVQTEGQIRESTGLGKLMTAKALTVEPEVHLRGMLVDEALIDLEKYLDDAYLAGLKEVRVIHGKGTGTLRAAVQQYLNKHPYVAGHRLGDYGEGGIGVTVVTLHNG